MSLTTLDQKSALVVIDLQKGLVGSPTVHPIGGVIENASALAAAFRRHGLPVVLVNVAGGAPGRTEQTGARPAPPADWADLVPELDQQPEDHTVTKLRWGAFTGTGLEEHLLGLDVSQVVLAGVATSIGVESTARFAHELGFHVTLAIDAMTDLDAGAHAHAIERVFPRLGETGRTEDVIALLDSERA